MKAGDLMQQGSISTVAAAVTAEDAARFYGLNVNARHKALCVWHNDRHPSLSFDPRTGRCYCFACNRGGDAVSLTAQLFNLTMMDAARKLNADFKLGIDVDGNTNPGAISETLKRRQEKRRRHDENNRKWAFLCDVVYEANAVLSTFPATDAAWDNPLFVNALMARSIADENLNAMWEGVSL